MNEDLVEDLKQQILQDISKGHGDFVLWGLNENTFRLLQELSSLGLLSSYVSGIVDPSLEHEGQEILGSPVILPSQVSDLKIDVLVVLENADKEQALRHYEQVDDRIPKVILSGTEHLHFRDSAFYEILDSCLVKSYATGYTNSLIHLFQSIKYLSKLNISGDVAEFGTFKGGTVEFIARSLDYFDLQDVKIYGFDIFEGFPQRRSVLDLYSNPECEFQDYEAVSEYCSRFNIEIIKGDICDTYQQIEGVPLMLTFFDTDNYSPVEAALEMCFNQTVRRGVVAFDHYTTKERFLYTIGERMAAREFLESQDTFHLHNTGIFVKL